jgi:hypothetical protein
MGSLKTCHDRSVQSLLIKSGPLARLLQSQGPNHLYHYTGPSGAIGILKSQTLWAGRPADMNDASEQALAQRLALEMLSQLQFPPRSYGEGMVQYAIERLSGFWRTERTASRTYTVSLTSQKDSLEQWRAYCPRSGGVALGFPMSHLRKVAAAQGFLLTPCVYDAHTHRAIVEQVVQFHLEVWDKRRPLDSPRQGISSHLVRAFIADLDRFAPLLKHSSFAAEREWRLISPLVTELSRDGIIHVPSEGGIKMFRQFSILTTDHRVIEHAIGSGLTNMESGFHVVLGPNVDLDGMEEAIGSLIPREFGWQHAVGRTVSPYR